jgi:hypothetical protein
VVVLRQIISAKALVSQVKKFCVERVNPFRYNIYINRRERLMSDNEFFKLDQEQWFTEYVDTEVSEIREHTNPHTEKFEFDDVPF